MLKAQIPENIRTLSRTRKVEFYNSTNSEQPRDYAIGQIWSTKSHLILGDSHHFSSDQPRIVVILDTSTTELIAAPISLEIQMAGEYDFIIRDEDNPLSFSFLIEVWNETPVVPPHLNRYLGSIPEALVDMLQELHAAYLLDAETTDRLKSYTGPSLFERDARLEFQAEEVRAIRYISQAATFSLTIPQTVKEIAKQNVLDFGVPTWRKLSDFLQPQKPAVALAASRTIDVEEAYVISHGVEANRTVMQLVVSKRRRQVYVIVQQVEEHLEKQRVMVSLKIHDKTLHSEVVELVAGARIDLGEYVFDPSEVVEPVTVELVQ
jgi:hypothetical protein